MGDTNEKDRIGGSSYGAGGFGYGPGGVSFCCQRFRWNSGAFE